MHADLPDICQTGRQAARNGSFCSKLADYGVPAIACNAESADADGTRSKPHSAAWTYTSLTCNWSTRQRRPVVGAKVAFTQAYVTCLDSRSSSHTAPGGLIARWR